MLPFELLLFMDINNIEMSTEGKDFKKSGLKDSTFGSFWSYNYNTEINLIKNEKLVLNNFSNN